MEHDERRLPDGELLLALTFSLVGCPGHAPNAGGDDDDELVLVDHTPEEPPDEGSPEVEELEQEIEQDVREALREELGEDEAL
jgi:hypothetical protein